MLSSLSQFRRVDALRAVSVVSVRLVERNAREWPGLFGHDNDALVDEDGYAFRDVSGVQHDDETPSGGLAKGNGIRIAIVRPRNFRDAATVGDYYRQEIPVIINLEDMDNADARRIIDFVSGLILGLGGDLEKISRRTFLIVPADSTIITRHGRLTEEGFFNQALRSVNAAYAGVPLSRYPVGAVASRHGQPGESRG
jgi:cell division inhibitor SepF